MDDRLTAVTAIVVGVAVTTVGTAEYLLPGVAPPPLEPFATGVFVVGAGLLLLAAGIRAYTARLDHLPLRVTTAVGLLTLAIAVFEPTSLLFGGVFWLALVAVAVIAAGTYRTYRATGEGSSVRRLDEQ